MDDNNESLSESLKSFLIERGAGLVGFADLESEPADVRNGLPRGVSITVALSPSIIAGIVGGPTEEYWHEYNRVNRLLNKLAQQTVEWIENRGFEAIDRPATVDDIDEHSLFSLLPHKTVATRAGLGWIGKSALLITKEYGAAIRLASVVTDAPFASGIAQTKSLCGRCMVCAKACPADAPLGKNWNANICREDFFDAVACYKNSLKMGQMVCNSRAAVICGICVAVCPYTQNYIRKT